MINHYFTISAANDAYETILIPCQFMPINETESGIWQYKTSDSSDKSYLKTVPEKVNIYHVIDEEEQLLVKLKGVEAVKSGITVLGIDTETWNSLRSTEIVKK